jgi:hypothetical protein
MYNGMKFRSEFTSQPKTLTAIYGKKITVSERCSALLSAFPNHHLQGKMVRKCMNSVANLLLENPQVMGHFEPQICVKFGCLLPG